MMSDRDQIIERVKWAKQQLDSTTAPMSTIQKTDDFKELSARSIMPIMSEVERLKAENESMKLDILLCSGSCGRGSKLSKEKYIELKAELKSMQSYYDMEVRSKQKVKEELSKVKKELAELKK